MMTIITLKHIFKEERIKELLENTKLLKDKYNSKSNSFENIVKLLSSLKEEKIRLYYNLIKTVSANDKDLSSFIKQTDISSNTVNNSNIDQFSSRNDSTQCSITSNKIVVDKPEEILNYSKAIQSESNRSKIGKY